jgi:hypothetical protein
MFPAIFNAPWKQVLILGAGEKGNDTPNILSLALLNEMSQECGANISDGRGRAFWEIQKMKVAC